MLFQMEGGGVGRVLGQLRRRHEDTKIGVRTGTEREPDDASGRRCVRATAGPEDRGSLRESCLHHWPGIEAHAFAARHAQMGRRRLGPGKCDVFINPH